MNIVHSVDGLRPDRLGFPFLVAASYFLVAHLSIELSGLTGEVAAAWPPNGILLAALLLSSPRRWLPFVLATACASVADSLLHGDNIPASLAFAAVNVCECLIAAAVLRHLEIGRTLLDSVRNVLLYVLVVVLAAAAGALLGASMVTFIYGGSYWASWLSWWIADLLGLLIVVPLLLAWLALPRSRRLGWARGGELVALFACTFATAFVAFGGVKLPPMLWPVSLFMIVPLQIWAAVRFERHISMALLPVVLVAAVFALTAFPAVPPTPVTATVAKTLLLLQATLALTSLDALTLVAAVHQSRQAEREAQAASARLRDAIDSMADGFALYDAGDMLELYNERGKLLLPDLADAFVRGRSYEDILRQGVERGLFAEADSQSEVWIAEQLRRHRSFADVYELPLVDGRCLLVRQRTTSEGGTVTIHSDITALKEQERMRLQEAEERRRRAEAERLARVLQQSEERYRSLVESSPDPIVVTKNGMVVFANAAAVKAFAVAHANDLAGRPWHDFINADSGVPLAEGSEPVQAQPSLHPAMRKYLRGDGGFFHGEASSSPIVWMGERAELTAIRDVSDRVRAETENQALEVRLRQAQKMESLGTLAGSTAHEFNNMLLPIVGFTELAIEEVTGHQRVHEYLDNVLASAQRAAQLVNRILAFSRAEEAELKRLDLRDAVEEAVAFLDSTFPATIEIEAVIEGATCRVLADATQVHQMIVNLATNAMHAINGRTGKLTIELDELPLDRAGERNPSAAPCRYARLRVRDTGCGMDEATLQRIFEPFFTTKEVGQGTGLGLAIVHGIVAAHGGFIEVESTPGIGTTFTIYLPRLEEEVTFPTMVAIEALHPTPITITD